MSIMRVLSTWAASGVLSCSVAVAQEPAVPVESLEIQGPAMTAEQAPAQPADCALSAAGHTGSDCRPVIVVDRFGWRNRGLVYGPLDCGTAAGSEGCSAASSGHPRPYGRAGIIHKGEAATPSGTTWIRHHGAQVSGCYRVERGGAIFLYNQRTPITETTHRGIVQAREQWLIRNGAVQSARIIRKSDVARLSGEDGAAGTSSQLPRPRAVIEVHKKPLLGPEAELQARDEQQKEATG